MSHYRPPFSISVKTLNLVANISALLGEWSARKAPALSPTLRRGNRIRTIQASLAIEHNTLSVEQVTSVIEGKRVLGLPREIQEVRNAFAAYEKLDQWQPWILPDLLDAHRLLMLGLVNDAGMLRNSGVGIYRKEQLVHMAPPASQLQRLIINLLDWLHTTDTHPLVASCVFHYEFEFIHPFSDGNGRMGRLWQTLILSHWNAVLAYLPVETLIHNEQEHYYQALALSDQASDATIFIEFMLQSLLQALQDLQDQTLRDQVSDQVSDQVKALLKHFGSLEQLGAQQPRKIQVHVSSDELMQALGMKHKPTFRKNYLNRAMEQGLISMTDPDSPRNPHQRYQLTDLGRQWLHKQNIED